MSGEQRPRAVSNGRLNLEQQRKRAKELLKAARAGEPEALARLARLGPAAGNAPRLADAQRVIALESGFRSWARLKHHVEAVAFARRNAGVAGDRDMPTVHVRCGSDIRTGLEIAGFQGRFLEFADPFCVGPVPALPEEAHIRGRARFTASAFGLAEADALARMGREYAALESLREYRRIVLWFEHDSYDQLILAYLLGRIGAMGLGARVELIAVDGVPGVGHFIGLGQLSPEVLAWLWERRVPVGEPQFGLGAEVWAALTSPTPEPLFRIARAGTHPLPLMAPALLRHLRELPDRRTGLGLTERLILEIVRDLGPLPLGRAFAELTREREPLPWLGDAMFGWMARGLTQGASPLLAIQPAPAGEPWFRAGARLTPDGERVLDGGLNRLDLDPVPRWVGGVRVPGEEGCWCWDGPGERPAWRAV